MTVSMTFKNRDTNPSLVISCVRVIYVRRSCYKISFWRNFANSQSGTLQRERTGKYARSTGRSKWEFACTRMHLILYCPQA